MGARWGKVVLMSFGRSHSLLCRERPERMWIDQLQYYRSNPVRGRRRFGTEEAEVRDILKTWTRLLGRLVLDGAWERECPGRRLGSELAQQERRWCQSLTVRHDAVQKAVMSYTGFTRLDQVTLGFISESIASLCLALCVFRACKWAFRGPSSLNWKILSAFSGGEVPFCTSHETLRKCHESRKDKVCFITVTTWAHGARETILMNGNFLLSFETRSLNYFQVPFCSECLLRLPEISDLSTS